MTPVHPPVARRSLAAVLASGRSCARRACPTRTRSSPAPSRCTRPATSLGAIEYYEAALEKDPGPRGGALQPGRRLRPARPLRRRRSSTTRRCSSRRPARHQVRFNLALALYKSARLRGGGGGARARGRAGSVEPARRSSLLADCRLQLGQDAGVVELLAPARGGLQGRPPLRVPPGQRPHPAQRAPARPGLHRPPLPGTARPAGGAPADGRRPTCAATTTASAVPELERAVALQRRRCRPSTPCSGAPSWARAGATRP